MLCHSLCNWKISKFFSSVQEMRVLNVLLILEFSVADRRLEWKEINIHKLDEDFSKVVKPKLFYLPLYKIHSISLFWKTFEKFLAYNFASQLPRDLSDFVMKQFPWLIKNFRTMWMMSTIYLIGIQTSPSIIKSTSIKLTPEITWLFGTNQNGESSSGCGFNPSKVMHRENLN